MDGEVFQMSWTIQANSDKMTLHADQDSLYTTMKARCCSVFAFYTDMDVHVNIAKH